MTAHTHLEFAVVKFGISALVLGNGWTLAAVSWAVGGVLSLVLAWRERNR